MDMPVTAEQISEEQTNDIARAWVKGSHWVLTIDAQHSRHYIIAGRTVVRDYVVDWTTHSPKVTETEALFSTRNQSVNSDTLKDMGWKRNKGSMLVNKITGELHFQ